MLLPSVFGRVVPSWKDVYMDALTIQLLMGCLFLGPSHILRIIDIEGVFHSR